MKHFILIVLAGFALLLAAACVTQKGVDKYYSKHPELLQLQSEVFFQKHPDLLSEKCAAAFPVVPQFVPGKDTVFKYDTIPGPEVPCPDGTKAPCPPSVKGTGVVHDTIKIPDEAKLYALQSRFNDSTAAFISRYNNERDRAVKAETQRDEYVAKYKEALKFVKALAGAVVVLILGWIFIKIK